jgi:hypothetical protein
MANYKVSTNTDNSNKATQDKTNKKQNNQRKMDQLRLLKLKYDSLKISIDSQTAFAADTHLAEGATGRRIMFRVGKLIKWEMQKLSTSNLKT